MNPKTLRLAAHATSFLVLALALALGWDRGPDPLIDFGRELYVPWRLTLGEVLHRDIGWFNGPLAPWLLEGWMRVFGVSLDAVQALDALVTVLVAFVLARLLERAAGGLVAWVGSLVFAGVFAVAQQEASGNFLFLAPYSHGITFGFLASVGALLCAVRGLENGTARPFAGAGVLAGLAFLTKAEIFLGLGVALGALGLVILLSPPPGARRGRWLGAFALGFALPLALALGRFAVQLESPREAFVALLGTWPHAFDDRVSTLPFYRMMRGTYDLPATLERLALACVLVPLHVGLCYGVAGAVGRRFGERGGVLLGAGVGFALTVAACVVAPIKWMLLPLVPFLPLVTAFAFIRAVRAEGTRRGAAVALLALAALGLGLQPKVLLVPLARQYGFVLSVPGTLLLVALLVRWIPSWRRIPERARPALTGAGLGVVLVFTLMNANATRNWFAKKVIEVGEGPDRMWADAWRGRILEEVREDLVERVAPGEALLVLPEGITLNYWVRRRTSTRLVNYMAPELVMFEEELVVRDLERDPPAVVVYVHRPTDIYGYPFFGQGYGEAIVDWVAARYEPVRRWGDGPWEVGGPSAFGAEVWIRRE